MLQDKALCDLLGLLMFPT